MAELLWLVVLTAPLWWPVYAVSRLEREVRARNRGYR